MKIKPNFQYATTSLALILLLTLSAVCAAKEINQEIPIEEHENIEIVVENGVFSISGWNQSVVSLSGDANQDVRAQRIDSVLALKLDSSNSDATKDNLEIKVPSDKKIRVISDNASLSFEGLNPSPEDNPNTKNAHSFDSGIIVTTVDGNVSIKNSSGDFNIQTVNGDIDISDSKGVMNIRTISGNQHIDADFRSVSSSNVSGQSLFKLRTLDKLNLSNVNGASLVESAISEGASIQMQSVKGDVELLIPESTSARFSLQSHQGGRIENSLNVEPDTVNDINDQQIFSLADSSASVTINTMDGGIKVGYKKAIISTWDDEDYDWSSVDTSLLNFAFVNPKYNIFDYQEVFIKQPEIHFYPGWGKKQGKGVNSLYQQRIAAEYSDLLKTAIADKFSRSKYFRIVDQRNENALVVIPKVLDLHIGDPETVVLKDVLTATRAGNASIDLVIFSPSDNAILALFMDKRSTVRPGGVAIPQSRIRNSRAFSRLFNEWVEDMVKVLEKQL